MKLLLNPKEIAFFLVNSIDYKKQLEKNDIFFKDECLQKYLAELHPKMLEPRAKDKLISKLKNAISEDLKNYLDAVKKELRKLKNKNVKLINTHIDYFIEKIGEEKIFDLYRKSKFQNFVKTVGYQLDPKSIMVQRTNYKDLDEDCLMRNTIGNEQFLIDKIDNNKPFWFIDSGYSNFLEPSKKWHRIVRNHIHTTKEFDAPADRLSAFPKFPKPWRIGGDCILVIEPGEFAAGIFHIDVNLWKKKVEETLRQYTDKKIIFREKINKKKRTPLVKELENDDYYCVVNINSNAATEAVWCGVPIITLDNHITNSVSKNKLSDINDLYRGSVAKWLCLLSYSQFTFDELMNGTAVSIMRKYHV